MNEEQRQEVDVESRPSVSAVLDERGEIQVATNAEFEIEDMIMILKVAVAKMELAHSRLRREEERKRAFAQNLTLAMPKVQGLTERG